MTRNVLLSDSQTLYTSTKVLTNKPGVKIINALVKSMDKTSSRNSEASMTGIIQTIEKAMVTPPIVIETKPLNILNVMATDAVFIINPFLQPSRIQ